MPTRWLSPIRARTTETSNRSGLNLPDGMSVLWANRLIHRGKNAPKERVRGTNLFPDIFEAGSQHRLRHYLLGSTPEVLGSLSDNLHRLFPEAQIVGMKAPRFENSPF